MYHKQDSPQNVMLLLHTERQWHTERPLALESQVKNTTHMGFPEHVDTIRN